MFKKLSYIFSRRDKWKLAVLFVLVAIGSVLELLGVTIFMPFIQIIMNPQTIFQNQILHQMYIFLGKNNTTDFLAALAGIIHAFRAPRAVRPGFRGRNSFEPRRAAPARKPGRICL